MSVYAYIKVHFLTLLLVYVVDVYFPYNTYFFLFITFTAFFYVRLFMACQFYFLPISFTLHF